MPTFSCSAFCPSKQLLVTFSSDAGVFLWLMICESDTVHFAVGSDSFAWKSSYLVHCVHWCHCLRADVDFLHHSTSSCLL